MTTLAGVVKAEIGVRYDVALGPDLGATTTMIGYTLAAGTQWTESTDIADNQRIVQISSPNQTDRFTFYPKVSQGSWNGGERQITFVDPNRYYQSQKLETSQDGHLYIYGYYLQSAALTGFTPAGLRTLAWDPTVTNNAWATNLGGAAGNVVKITDNGLGSVPTLANATISNVNDTVYELLSTPFDLYGFINNGTAPGFYIFVNGAFARVSTSTDMLASQHDMAYYNNTIFYINTSTPNQIQQIINPAPAGGASTTAITLLNMEADSATTNGTHVLGSSATGLFYSTSGNPGSGNSRFYVFDGTTSTLVGETQSGVWDIIEAAGIVFILCYTKKSSSYSYQPLIYSYTGGQLNVFDDFRYLPSAFQINQATSVNGSLSTDGTFLYLAWPGMNVKRYDLRNFPTVVISDIGNPNAATPTNTHTVAASSGAVILETNISTNRVYMAQPTGGTAASTNDTGYLITSYYDMGAPTTTKVFRSLEIELNAAMVAGASVAVAYNLDTQTAFANTLTVTTSTLNNLICFFPANTKAARVQFKITLTSGNSSGASPDIRSISVNGRLGRVWKCTVQCRRQVTTQDGALDQQGQRSQDLLANIVNVYQKAAGNAILFVPDATSSTGVSQVNAVLEDYTIKTPKPGPSLSEQASADLEADCELTFVERL